MFSNISKLLESIDIKSFDKLAERQKGAYMPRLCNNDTCWRTGVELNKASKETESLKNQVVRLKATILQSIKVSDLKAILDLYDIEEWYEEMS